ncbi:MAG: glutamine--fructose-6-phosphate transaminase (isomerizing) [Candidatus Marinimicrobia bacterium]|jgi:glucosamine--fructose-6-phosphate aminotransferase (isomerizing)|nr:glutamine--fructose-6-phosphate transaminase (isomerizing) [Candidatus Neomarinimicrobiota bacterium]MBT3632835.1 glutamine--fructose-6-phosphate transaminase (isomerizing) [Candidatus Neomarinimicrobiota bacterium]MBT3681945.1 glutamine--fructose-6-phosphate transaminase (isomerizing) [Candidatus Neomarinimicrobiota bacterium]MBT3759026.1 glutamine--fructose-6-phosphate transaminase (isomerizing) [Candidatus Neomarinimicrobiota bacterium]MBT3895075.1 glutamine--fructose-6-phosphate transami
MCGIVGYIGSRNTTEIIIKGLQRLEYRGYDSAGISVFDGENLSLVKCKGKVKELKNLLNSSPVNGNIGMGHTRWATHGEPNDANAHPHMSSSGLFTLIHNGIIENYYSIRKFLTGKGIEFVSDTDTEVLVQFIEYLYLKNNLSFAEAVRSALQKVVGAYGIVVLCKDEPDKLIAARHGSPLVLGIGEGEYFLASDTSPIIEYTRKIVYLDENEMTIIKSDSYEVRNIEEYKVISKEIQNIDYDLEQIEKGGYEHFMLKEIYEQPTSVYESTRGRIDLKKMTVKLGGIENWLTRILDANQIVITACGTSWHAAQIGSYIIEELVNITVKVEYASEFRYRETPIDNNTVVFAISQSGETADTLAAIRKARTMGALSVGIVNVVGSSIARETDCGVYIHAGPEIGVASTKAFTSQVTVLTEIALLLAQKKKLNCKMVKDIIRDFSTITEKIEKVFKQADKIKNIAKDFATSNNFLYLGRGYQFPVALEGALKLKEISYIHAEGYPAAEMKHGPIALIDENMPVLFIVTQRGFDKIMSNIQEVNARGGRIIIITSVDTKRCDEYSDHVIKIPAIHHCISPILTTIPTQLLAYYIAVERGCNVDQPRNLAKSVTVE